MPVDQANGNAHPKQAESAQATAEMQIDAQLRQVVGIMFRGILVSAPGIPAQAIMASIARVTGELIGQAVVGELGPVLTIRRMCKEAFDKSLSAAPIKNPATPPPMNLNS